MADYRIESDGTVVVYLSEKATKWVTEPKPAVGERLAFTKKSDTADFVEAMEAEGFTFEGKEYLTAAWSDGRDTTDFSGTILVYFPAETSYIRKRLRVGWKISY